MKKIIIPIIFVILVVAGYLVSTMLNNEGEVVKPNLICSFTQPDEEDLELSSNIIEYIYPEERMICSYYEDTLSIETSFYVGKYSDESELQIMVDYEDVTQNLEYEEFTFYNESIALTITFLYDPITEGLISYTEEFYDNVNNNLDSIEVLENFDFTDSSNVFERINEIVVNNSLD